VGVRNFVLGPFLQQACEQTEEKSQIHALHAIPNSVLPTYSAEFNGHAQWHTLISYQERPLLFLLRNSLVYVQMYWVDSRAMRAMRNRPLKGTWRTKAAFRAARLIGRVAASPRGIRYLDRWHCSVMRRQPELRNYRQLFRKIKPSVLFCSHQRPPSILAPVLAARSLGIPTATFIFSWDNLSSKGRIAAPFDHYLVWSEHMRQELLRYYPDVSKDRVHIVGTPQFDPYADEDLLWSREEFFQRIGADPARPLICYSGGDLTICPEEPQHVRVLLEYIRSGRIKGNPQVLLRPAPVDEGSRYDDVRRDHPELLYAQPQWAHTKPGDWISVLPLSDDVRFLSNLTHHADLNINVASTMTLDFALHDKPVVNIAYDFAAPPPLGVPLWEYYYQFEHYRPVVELGAARFARSAEELAEHVNAYLENPALDREGRRRLVELQVGVPVGQSSRHIIEVLERIGRKSRG
jgi:hypothetical protein